MSGTLRQGPGQQSRARIFEHGELREDLATLDVANLPNLAETGWLPGGNPAASIKVRPMR